MMIYNIQMTDYPNENEKAISEYFKTVEPTMTDDLHYTYDNCISPEIDISDLPYLRDKFKINKPKLYEPVDDKSPINFLTAYNRDPDYVIELFSKIYAEKLKEHNQFEDKEQIDINDFIKKKM